MRTPGVMKGIATLVLCLMLASAIEGCTAIGYAVGARMDSRNGSGGPDLLMHLKVGQPVTLLLHDGRKLEGRFSGWSPDSGDASSVADSLPLGKASVRLASRGGEVLIRPEDIESVSVRLNSGKATGLLVGAALDVLAVLAFIYGMEQATSSAFGR